MDESRKQDPRRAVNPAARNDRPADAVRRETEQPEPRVKGTQEAPLEPRHDGGIAE